MTGRHDAALNRRPGDLLVRTGAAVFGLGVVGVVLILVTFLTGSRRDAPTSLDLVALLLPVGFGMALLGLLRGVRSHRKSDR